MCIVVDDVPRSLLYVGYMLRFEEEMRKAYTSVVKLGYAGVKNQRNNTSIVVGDDIRSLLYVGYVYGSSKNMRAYTSVKPPRICRDGLRCHRGLHGITPVQSQTLKGVHKVPYLFSFQTP